MTWAGLRLARCNGVYAGAPNIIDMAAVCTADIVRNRPLVDGNKRTGFVIGVLFLELNGHSFKASEGDATNAVSGLAAGTLDESSFAVWLKANVTRRR